MMGLDLGQCLFLDFEARSEIGIDDVGAQAYAEHPTTEPLCCAWAVGLGEIHLWRAGDGLPVEWFLHAGRWVAYNKDTERHLLREKFLLDIKIERWVDVAVWSSAAGMPRNLHDAAAALHLQAQKLDRAAMLALAKPRKLSRKNAEKWWTREQRPELYEQMEAYCIRDVEVMREMTQRLPPYHWVLNAREERLSLLTDRMNDRGIPVDLAGVVKAQALVEAHDAELRARFTELVPGVNPRNNNAESGVAKHLGLSNARKDTVRDALKWANGELAEALTILKTIKTASTAKLKSIIARAARDRRVHGEMVFHGAGRTGRWSSMGIQVHNLVRGLGSGTVDWPALDTSDGAMGFAHWALSTGLLDRFYANVTRAVASMMKGFFCDLDEGLLIADLMQIEARTLAAWAGQTDMVEAFRSGRDFYKIMAALIYGILIEQVNSDQRFMGKQTVLGAGYQIGKHGFKAMLKEIYDIDIELEEADRIVRMYRKANRRIVALWYDVDAFIKRVLLEQPDHFIKSPKVPKVMARMVGRWLAIGLPSGRCLWYFEPEMDGDRITYWGRNPKAGGAWMRVETYGGKLVENITQAIARDVIADALLRLEEQGFKPLFQVHDSTAVPGSEDRLPEFKSIISSPPKWWPELPVDVDAYHDRRYQ